MIPFLAEDLKHLIKGLMKRFIKVDVLRQADSLAALVKVDIIVFSFKILRYVFLFISFSDRKAHALEKLQSSQTRLYCLFLQRVIPAFNQGNVVLQSDKPMIQKIYSVLKDLLKQVLLKFVKPSALMQHDILTVPYTRCAYQKEDIQGLVYWLGGEGVHPYFQRTYSGESCHVLL